MKKLLLLLLLSLGFVSLSFAHSGRTDSSGGHNDYSNGTYHYHNSGNSSECHCISDESGNYGCYTASGAECGSSRGSVGGGGLGDWTGTESIGAWLGLLLILSFVIWFIKEIPNSIEEQKQKKLKEEERQKNIQSRKSDSNLSEEKIDDKPDPFANFNKTQDKLILGTKEGRVHITGVENGKSVEYYEDGSKLYEGNWLNGKQEGTSFAYHRDGTKWIEMNHQAGVLNGIKRNWHSNGEIEEISNYLNGKLERESNAWFPDGSIKYKQYYVNGVLQNGSVYFDKNGKPTTLEQQLWDDYDDSDEAIMEGFIQSAKAIDKAIHKKK